jgi:heme exporter protein A
VVAPGVAKVEAPATEDLGAGLLEAGAHLVAVVHHEAEVALGVGRLRATFGQDQELVAHVDERHPPDPAAQLELEDAAVEGERFVEVVHLEHDVVDADQARHCLSIGFPLVAAIELDGLERRFGERVALAGVSVRVEQGRTLAVLGGNGAGKTTLLRVLAGLLRPHGGRARVLDAVLPGERWKLPGRVGYLGHEPLLYRELSGRENLRYHASLHGVAAARVDELLGAVGMERRAEDPVRELSRGMVQRLAVARAVLHDPPLLLLDEPRANLDPAAAELLEPLIGRASGRTRVLVSHDVEGALAEADEVLRLKRGRPVGEDEELYR